jgi:uncharacterized protein YecE (DUF72 family)
MRVPSMMERRVGTAGWTLPRELRALFNGQSTHLELYGRHFPCVEVNSSFYRSHRASTYERWARSVPDAFRFALKVPKEITHARRFVNVEEPLSRFLDESSGLGAKRDVLLVQLPPSFAYDAHLVESFFALLREQYAGRVACEPRHVSWFEPGMDDVLRAFRIARIAADPAPADSAALPGGSNDVSYWRLHGSPVVYRSAYERPRLDAIVGAMRAATGPAWCIFDNTTFGAATANALTVLEALHADKFVGEAEVPDEGQHTPF